MLIYQPSEISVESERNRKTGPEKVRKRKKAKKKKKKKTKKGNCFGELFTRSPQMMGHDFTSIQPGYIVPTSPS